MVGDLIPIEIAFEDRFLSLIAATLCSSQHTGEQSIANFAPANAHPRHEDYSHRHRALLPAIDTREIKQTSFHAVVLQVRLGEVEWELPFLPLAVNWHANNCHRAMRLLCLVDELCGTAWSQDTSEPPRTLKEAIAGGPSRIA